MSKEKELEKRVKNICKVLVNMNENEFKYLRIQEKLDKNYECIIGNFRKNGRGSYAIRLRYGINTLLKIRNSEEFKQIKSIIEFLDKNPEYVLVLDRVNGNSRKTRQKDNEDMFI